ncbi:toll/interleukin-1 receptor domain-containing protein [Lutibacter sp.]|uniref:toll/interleukin-1 receptor domain-containing protein n=1 Tax=Lutibacter sp. TaxID=1925666 RepID=UPI0025BD45E0|nr:toll/interleukin-1 receptor domain-containing protein [Lutibacter sp.]MCF6167090.1 toll/interleukin-1 receptor domain-containing protein [Lutibacter sp.]
MSSNTIFISYSRKDADFVSKFTKKLREAGANLWLDKQIKPGGLWDDSIESALESCQDIILIMSKNSVESGNVMDEISYALEERKRVIPVKIEECDVPFRLRRIQHIDYYLDEEKSMDLLINTLDQNSFKSSEAKKLASKKSSVEIQQEKVQEKVQEKPKPEKQAIQNKPKKKKGTLKYIIGALVLILGIYFMSGNSDDTVVDETNNNIPVVTDAEDWDRIKESIKIEDFQNHLKKFPEGSHINQANLLISMLQSVADEEKEWYAAVANNTANDFLNYIMNYRKKGIFYTDAVKTLDNFFTSSGFVQFSSSTGEMYFSVFESTNNNIPQVNDLIFSTTPRNIHAEPYGTVGFNSTIYTTSKDEVFKIKSVEKSGNAYWVQVTF